MLKLGDNIVLTGLYAPQSLRRSVEAKYAEISIATGKPRLQRVGTALIEYTLPVRLNRQFCNPQEILTAIEDANNAGTVLPLTTSEGSYLGQYVVTAVSTSTTDTTATGEVIEIALDITLREYYDPDPGATAASLSRSKAFANDPSKVMPVQPFAVPITPPASISQNARLSLSYNTGAVEKMKEAEADAARQKSLMAQAKQKVEQAAQRVQTVVEQLQQYTTLAAAAPSMIAAAQSAASLLSGTITALGAGNLGAALANAQTVDNSLITMINAGLPLETMVVSRRG